MTPAGYTAHITYADLGRLNVLRVRGDAVMTMISKLVATVRDPRRSPPASWWRFALTTKRNEP